MVRGRFIDKKFLHGKTDRWKHELSKKYLKENYKEFISSFEASKVEQNVNGDSPIWCFWVQGIIQHHQ
ncbi:capsular polysaccharide synthesis protein [Clostridium nigeriense]|uniref:capsular polysaccharide synthesis protein n=1 Tax=Clostridium nigeriense TaxID=1805470 RepID=UPI003D34ED65